MTRGSVISFIEPEYTVPSQRTITARVERMYAEKREKFKFFSTVTPLRDVMQCIMGEIRFNRKPLKKYLLFRMILLFVIPNNKYKYNG